MHVILVHKPGYNLELQALKVACKRKTKKKKTSQNGSRPDEVEYFACGWVDTSHFQ
jgi:hypothetical protein